MKRENEEAKKEIYGIISEIEAEGSPFASDKKLQEKIEELEKKIKSYPRKCTRNSHIIHTLRNLFTSYGIGIRQRGDYRGYRNKKGVVIKEKEKRLRERKLDIKKIRKKIMSYLDLLIDNDSNYFEKEIGKKEGCFPESKHRSSEYIDYSIKAIDKNNKKKNAKYQSAQEETLHALLRDYSPRDE